MKAVVYTEYGTPDVLHIAEVAKPTPKDDEILVRVHAHSINVGDLMARKFPSIPIRDFPMPSLLWLVARLSFGVRKPRNTIMGSEFSGVVEAVGADVQNFQPGDAVFGYRGQDMGASAEYLTTKASGTVSKKPTNMTHEEAATVPYGAVIALNLLKKANIQPGQHVMIIGASGGIGTAAVQLAKHAGAEVTGVAGTPRLAYVRALGADHVIDYTREDYTAGDERYDLVFDTAGKGTFRQVKRVLKPGGRYQRASFKMKHIFQMLSTSLFGSKKVVVGLALDSKADLEYIRDLIEAGVYKSVVDRCFPLAQTGDAHRYAESGNKQGQIVIKVV